MTHRTVRRALALVAGLSITAAGLAGATAAPGVRLPKRPGPAPAAPAPASDHAIGGESRYDTGRWTHTDFVYDDGERVDNAADLVSISVRPDGIDLVVTVVLNTLRATDTPVVGIAIAGADDDTARDWPFGAGVRSPWEQFVTVVPNSGTATSTAADGSSTGLAAPVVDLARNTVEVRVPGAAAGGGERRLNGGAGVWDGDSWAGDPGVVDLFFNRADLETNLDGFRGEAQAAAVEAGDVAAFSGTVDLDRVVGGRADPPFTTAGVHTAVFASRQSLGEGYGAGFPKYNGLHQPYALWLPEGLDPTAATPLVLVLHSLGQIHNQYADGEVYPQVAGALGAIAVTPLALGEDGWYWDEGLIDSLDVWADVRRRYTVDPERTLSSGYSMGGYGTYRLATIAPDLLTAGISWVGPPTDGIWTGSPTTVDTGLTYHQLENTNHVPFFIVHGTNDELVPVLGVTLQAERFKELGHEYRYNLHPGQDHFSFAVIDDWTREAQWVQGRSRATAPANVSFVARPATWAGRDAEVSVERRNAVLRHLSDLLAELGGAEPDSAYWVRGVVVAGHDPVAWNDVSGTVDLTSHAVAARVPVTNEVTGVGVFGSSPHVVSGVDRFFTVDPAAAPVANALSGSLTNVSEVTVDLARAGLRLDGLDVSGITADRQVTLRLVDGKRSRTVVVPAG